MKKKKYLVKLRDLYEYDVIVTAINIDDARRQALANNGEEWGEPELIKRTKYAKAKLIRITP